MSYDWTPTNNDIQQIEAMCQYWLPEKYIATILGVTVGQYQKAKLNDQRVERAEESGRAKGARRLYQTAFQVAVENKNVNMLTFVLKSQEKWRDSDPANINIANFSGSLPTTEEAIKILEKYQQRSIKGDVEVVPLDEDVVEEESK